MEGGRWRERARDGGKKGDRGSERLRERGWESNREGKSEKRVRLNWTGVWSH